MTENEAILELQQNIELPFGRNVSDEASKIAIQALEEVQQYRTIGTIEELQEAKIQYDNINSAANSVALSGLCDFSTAKESIVSTFKALKENQRNCKDCAGCTTWKCDCANESAYATDEFVKAEDYLLDRIKEKTADVNIDFEWRKVVCLDDIRRMLHQGLYEIAEQMKAGGENE